MDFEKAFESYLKLIDQKITKYRKNFVPPTLNSNETYDIIKHTVDIFDATQNVNLTCEKGRKYIKVLEGFGSFANVHSFVEIRTGLIYKPASYYSAAKHARGNIFENNGAAALDDKGNVIHLK